MTLELFHNPRCSKSRDAVQFLEGKNIDFQTTLYLTNGPSKKELKTIIKKLKIPAPQLIRTKDKFFKENYHNKKLTEEEAIELMVKYPILIERPILISSDAAAIGRPLSNFDQIL